MTPKQPAVRSSQHRRAWLLALLTVLAVLPAGCSQQTILRTVSCPVYQPPQTPLPEWPKECGGTR